MANRIDLTGRLRTPPVIAALIAGLIAGALSCAPDGEAVDSLAASAKAPGPGQTASSPEDAAVASWPIFRGNPALEGVADAKVPEAPVLLWRFEAGGAITSSPVVENGIVYFGSDDYHLRALDLVTGEERWSFATEDLIEAPPMVHDGVVYIGSSDFFFYALDAESGELRWKIETDDKILGSANWFPGPVGAPDRILVGSYDTHLYCLDSHTGEAIWTYKTDNYVNGTPAVLGDRVIFGGCDAQLHVVSAATGEGLRKIDLGPESHVAGSVGLADDKAFLGHDGNAFVCVDLLTGELVWDYPNPRYAFFSSPAIGADRVVFGGRDKHLHCAKREDGTPLWTFPTRRKVDSSPVIAGDRVVFGSGDGRVYIVDLNDGTELWSYDIGQSIFSSPAVVGGMILIGANDGGLYAFGERDEQEENG